MSAHTWPRSAVRRPSSSLASSASGRRRSQDFIIQQLAAFAAFITAHGGKRRVSSAEGQFSKVNDRCTAMLHWHESYIREHLEDMPEVRAWAWGDA
jgi:phosphoketolase